MKEHQIEVYNYYKELYPGMLLLFHKEDYYVALFEDAHKIAEILNHDNYDDVVRCPDNDLDLIAQIASSGSSLKMIDYRNTAGIFDFPDIDVIKQEKFEDY